MNKDVLTIIKKECARFFGDKRLFFTSVIMPGLLIFVLYTFMGKGLAKSFTTSEDYVSEVYTVNLPSELAGSFNALPAKYTAIENSEVEANKEKILSDEIDCIIVFPDNFIDSVNNYSVEDGTEAPNVSIYYNSADTDSTTVYQGLNAVLAEYEASISNKFDVNRYHGDTTKYDQATEKETTGMIFSMMMPLLLLIFLYSGCMAIAPDSIAGEKERGTIATLLVTPMKRSSLALGKVISLSIFSLLSGISSFIGTMLSMPSLMGSDSSAATSLSASVYSVKDYCLLLALILSTVLLFVSILSVISAYAKSVKEAGTLVLPFMMVVMIFGVTSMMGGKHVLNMKDAVIPIMGTVRSLGGIFAFNYSISCVLVTVLVNIVCSVIFTVLLTRMFNDERVMFSN